MSRRTQLGKFRAAANSQHQGPPPREPVVHTPAPGWVLWLVPTLIALVTFGAFLPTLHNQFVNWDDPRNFLDNPHYRGLGWSPLRWMWTTHQSHYIPLTWMTLGLDYLLWGMNPFGYHLTSLLLHAANAVAFFFVVRRILKRALPSPSERGHALALSAGFAALVFAIHPLRVESVAWVTERRDVLSGLFYLSAILIYLRTCERGARGRGWYWAAVGLFAGALLSKSMVVNLPIVLLILGVYPLRRLGGAIGWWSEPARRVYVEKIPFVLLAAAAAAIALMAQLSHNTMVSVVQLSGLGRLAVSAYGLSFYLWKTVAPVNLSPLYELPPTVNPWAPPFIVSYGVVLAITAIVLAFRRRVPGLPAAWVAYIVVLLPVLGIFQSGPQIAADRYTYLAGLGWALLTGAALLSVSRRLPFLSTGLAFFLLLGLGPLTWNQVHVWHDSEKLWSHAVAIDPGAPVGQYSRGWALAQKGKLTEAMAHYQTALRLNPDYAEAHNAVGALLADQGKLAEASEHYQTALRLKPDHAEAHGNVGSALARQGKLAEAVEHYQTALRFKPDYADVHYNWGNALTREGKLAEAIEHYRQALQIKPDHAVAHYDWGDALIRQDKPAEASEHYRQALLFKPGYAIAHINWGVALAQQGQVAEAIDHYRQALQLEPDFADAHANWGLALIQQGKLAEAFEHLQQALRINPDHAAAQSNLLNALRGLDRRR